MIALIPHVVWESNDDRRVLRRLYEDFGQNERLILVEDHTEQGEQALDRISGNMIMIQTDREKALRANPAYAVQAKPHHNRDAFFAQLRDIPFVQLVDQLLAPTKYKLRRQKWEQSITVRVIRKLKRIIRK